MKKQAAASLSDFLRTYYSESDTETPARIAYIRAEAWHFTIYGAKRFKNYECFKNIKCRFLKSQRAKARKAATLWHPCPPSRDQQHFALFEAVLIAHVPSSEAREDYRRKWAAL